MAFIGDYVWHHDIVKKMLQWRREIFLLRNVKFEIFEIALCKTKWLDCFAF